MKYYNKKTGEEITVLQAEKMRDNEKLVFDDVKFEKIKGRKANFSDMRWFKVNTK